MTVSFSVINCHKLAYSSHCNMQTAHIIISSMISVKLTDVFKKYKYCEFECCRLISYSCIFLELFIAPLPTTLPQPNFS